jgi:hypothetical protein
MIIYLCGAQAAGVKRLGEQNQSLNQPDPLK